MMSVDTCTLDFCGLGWDERLFLLQSCFGSGCAYVVKDGRIGLEWIGFLFTRG